MASTAPANIIVKSETGFQQYPSGLNDLLIYLVVRVICGKLARIPLNICIVMDVSGSMATNAITGEFNHWNWRTDPNTRFRCCIRAIVACINMLQNGDVISVITYSETSTLVIRPTVIEGNNRRSIIAQVEAITPNGQDKLSAGMETAMQVIQHYSLGHTNVIVGLSDGHTLTGEPRNIQSAEERYCEKLGKDIQANGTKLVMIAYGTDGDIEFLRRITKNVNYIPDGDDKPAIETFKEEVGEVLNVGVNKATLNLKFLPGIAAEGVAIVYPKIERLDLGIENREICIPIGDIEIDNEVDVLVALRMAPPKVATSRICWGTVSYNIPSLGIVDAKAQVEQMASFSNDIHKPSGENKVMQLINPYIAWKKLQAKLAGLLHTPLSENDIALLDPEGQKIARELNAKGAAALSVNDKRNLGKKTAKMSVRLDPED